MIASLLSAVVNMRIGDHLALVQGGEAVLHGAQTRQQRAAERGGQHLGGQPGDVGGNASAQQEMRRLIREVVAVVVQQRVCTPRAAKPSVV